MKFFGMLVSQMMKSRLQLPDFTHPSNAPYMDMMITIGTTIQLEMQMTFLITLLSGFTRKRNANPFAIPETRNQSQQNAKTYAIGNPSHAAQIVSKFSTPI